MWGKSVHGWPWICGVKLKPKAVNKPSPHSIKHGLDKPGVFTTVSKNLRFLSTTTPLLSARPQDVRALHANPCPARSRLYSNQVMTITKTSTTESRSSHVERVCA